ncbi:MAG: hypothetical protein JXO44_06700 [Clostridia bacterium]|nr:hypothetical protein [Clostridia bacterium]
MSYYQVAVVLCIIPCIGRVFWDLQHPTKEQGAAMYGIVVFFMAAVYDIVMYSDLLGGCCQ